MLKLRRSNPPAQLNISKTRKLFEISGLVRRSPLHRLQLSNILKKKSPPSQMLRWAEAERGGFEPPVPVTQYDSLANCWFQPLTHLSLMLSCIKSSTKVENQFTKAKPIMAEGYFFYFFLSLFSPPMESRMRVSASMFCIL
jgi:hypothetical protein